jgi:hypothetical protein
VSAKSLKLCGRKGIVPEILQRRMKKCGEVQIQLHSPFISTLDGDKWSDPRPSG